MASVTFPPEVGGSGLTVTDDANPTTGLANGGHRARFVPALAQVVAVAQHVVDTAEDVNTDAATASSAAATATTQAGIATTKASEAAASALAASNSATAASNSADEAEYWAGQAAGSVTGVASIDGQQGALETKTINGNEILGAGNISVGDVTLTDAQTLSNKTVVGVTDTVYAASGTSLALSNANGMIQTWALTANSTLTDSLTSGQSVLLQVTPSTFTLTYPTTVWTKAGGGGTAPTLFGAGKTNILFWKVGATLYGTHLGDA